MAQIKSPTLFFVTSPRTPFKMRAEIALLVNEFSNQKWKRNVDLQASFMKKLAQLPEFEGSYNQNDPAFSARDRITRGPKSLGFVNLDKIELTPTGRNFLDDDLADEALLRQLLKFQLPSPFHKTNPRIDKSFCIRPYLEILRLIYVLGRLAFDELCLFAMLLTDWHNFDATVESVRKFRIAKERNKGHYKKFIQEVRRKLVCDTFAQQISKGHIRTRESSHISIDKFINTKIANLRDYADACLRYLRATGIITVTNPGRTISIIESRREDVKFILENVDRNPIYINNEKAYCEYLFDSDTPVLLTDNRDTLEQRAVQCLAVGSVHSAKTLDSSDLKKRIKHAHEVQKQAIITSQITELKAFTKYNEIVEVFNDIKHVYDPPLALEWNVWRAMTMMDGGSIHANLNFDDAGNPLSTAPGKQADIVCDYGDFTVTVEVTLMSGSKQYDAEGEPVARHLGDIKALTGRQAFCIFVAPKLNESTISHFYMLHRTNVRHYGGKSVIIPLTLDRFVGMLTQAKNCGYIPSPDKMRSFCEYSMCAAIESEDEEAWYEAISQKADSWLT